MDHDEKEDLLDEISDMTNSSRDDMFYNISPNVFTSAIMNQIEYPTSINGYTANQLEKFDEKISALIQEAKQMGEEEVNHIVNVKNSVYDEILNKICEKFNINVDDTMTGDSIIKILYEFYVIGYTNYIIGFFYGYIMGNRKDYHRQYSEEKVNNNPITSSKKLFKDSKDAFIVGNLYDIIQEIIDMDITDEDFFEYIISSGIVDTTIVEELKRNYNSGVISSSGDSLYSDFLIPVKEDSGSVININMSLQDVLIDALKIDNPSAKLIPDGVYDGGEEE